MSWRCYQQNSASVGSPPMSSLTAEQPTPAEKLATVLTGLADGNFRGYSPLYERVARQWADDEDALETVIGWARPTELPIRVFAAVHDLTLREPGLDLASIYRGGSADPWPPFRRILLDRRDELATSVRERSIQTNEVGRSAMLVPVFTWAHQSVGADRPLALVELGPSAGLNLLFDRYHVEYSDGRQAGDPSSGVRLTCELLGTGHPPLPTHPLPIAQRTGIDRAPIDPRDPTATRWLEACVWPDVPDRLARLRAALSMARTEPLPIWRGDVLDLLGAVLDSLPDDTVPVVFSTWVLAYLDAAGRQAVHDLVDQRGAARDVALLTAEYPQVTPWVTPSRPAGVDDDTDATFVAASVWRDGVEHSASIAWTHAHGAWLDWMAPDTPAGTDA
jgi:hypothetical protein